MARSRSTQSPGEVSGLPIGGPTRLQNRFRHFLIAVGALSFVFSWQIVALVKFAWSSDLHSYAILIPFLTAYLIWMKRDRIPPATPAKSAKAAWPLALGVIGIATYGWLLTSGAVMANEDALALVFGSYVLLLASAAICYLDSAALRACAFPLSLLVFIVPLPGAVTRMLESILQHGSATAAHYMFTMSGMPVFHEGVVFSLPGIVLHVAPECSGIRSSLALLITSLVAGYLFLRSPGHRAILALAVVPLAFLRNGFRVFVIGELCVRVGPEMSESFIHRHGGPLFFALSLIPFAAILYFLVKLEVSPSAKVSSQ
jgi:exosortase C (VPDSG-CTERM-specific)